ncbi:MAG: LytTR family DNA-binding domain-containing protein [Bacteroidales bacterium]|jgi:DNA-binding LytR/AlgR family response regulator|nr:LytTR family DNA-binding domain-containing protein [Bacteroidales bacterium]
MPFSQAIRTVIVDDEMSAVLLLETMLRKIEGVTVDGYATDLESGLNLILNGRPDIVFLDIRLGENKGFELIRALKDYDLDPMIVMVTGYDQFAMEAIKAGVFDYLLKPVNPDELLKVISRYRQKISRLQSSPAVSASSSESIHKLRFNTLGGFILVNPDEIIYGKAEANYTDLYLIDQRMHTISMNIGKIEETLRPPQFFRISRSVIINLNYLTEISRGKRQCTLTANYHSYSLTIAHDRIRDLEAVFIQ